MPDGLLRQAQGDQDRERAEDCEVAGGEDKKESTHSTGDIRENTARIWGI